MNRILNINLGGYALTIDDDAHEYLEKYLADIRRRFSETEGRDEIMRDVEARMGELISQSMGSRSIVMLPDVESAAHIMGKPEDFGEAQPAEEKKKSSGSASAASLKGKRLFRDEEDAIIGGVCSGLAAYVGLHDSMWMRFIFILLAVISAGFWIPVYFLLWLIVPPAASTSDRLSMRGQAVTVENIARELEKGAQRVGSQFGPAVKSASGGCMTVIGKLALGLLIFIAASMIFGLGSMWVAGIWTFITAQPFLAYFSPFSETWTYFAFACLFLLIGIPVVGLVLWLGRVIFKFKSPSWLGVSLGVTWVISFISVVLMTGLGIRSFRQSGTVTKNVDLSTMTSDTLRVNYADAEGAARSDFDFDFKEDDFKIDGDKIHIRGPLDIRVRKAGGNQFECTQNITARGATHLEAVENAGSTQFTPQLIGNTLLVPSHYGMQSGRKWRTHTVKLDIDIPVGKYVVFGKGVNNRARNIDAYADRDGNYYIDEYPERVFKMTSKGLVCTDCPSFGSSDYRSNRSYENFVVEGKFDLEIRKGDEFRLTINGPEELKNNLSVIRSGDQLTLATDDPALAGKISVIIETPVFTTLHADQTGPVVIRGFDEHRSSISAKGDAKIKALYDCNNLTLNLDGPDCSIELIGEGQDLDVDLGNGAGLESSAFKVDNAKIRALDGSKARVFARHNAEIKADASSVIKIEGGAEVNREE